MSPSAIFVGLVDDRAVDDPGRRDRIDAIDRRLSPVGFRVRWIVTRQQRDPVEVGMAGAEGLLHERLEGNRRTGRRDYRDGERRLQIGGAVRRVGEERPVGPFLRECEVPGRQGLLGLRQGHQARRIDEVDGKSAATVPFWCFPL